jgi:hypothetical protein
MWLLTGIGYAAIGGLIVAYLCEGYIVESASQVVYYTSVWLLWPVFLVVFALVLGMAISASPWVGLFYSENVDRQYHDWKNGEGL